MDTPFVTTEWLAARLDTSDIVVVDASWFLPNANRRPHEEYLAGHIPGAVFFDIDGIADSSRDLPHMLLPPDAFAHAVGALGIGDGRTIVVYDEAGLFSAPRAWWEFVVMGAPDVRILEGGGPKWRAEGRPLQSGEVRRAPETFTPRFRPDLVRGLGEMRAAIDAGEQIADARPAGRFAGRDPEPRPNLPSGHMPGAVNLPALDLVADGRLRLLQDLAAMFRGAGLDLDRPIVTTCGSGVTASTLMLALRLAGARDVAVYDGSWAEYGADPQARIERDA